ncbi:MAG TPA: YraN family protein [Methylomirabilota bacterium]|nr:YraN family protein [Methylomirabilota bacterium]
MFRAVHWAARKGLRETLAPDGDVKRQARETGVRGETYAYWYLRRLGYVFIARNYMPRGGKGEIDLIGYDGNTLAFVEVRTRTIRKEQTALPELSVTEEKRRTVLRTARRFLAATRRQDTAIRFDVLAIDNRPGESPRVRLHKDALSPEA